MFKLVWARSRGRGRTHCPGPGSDCHGNREAAAGRSRGVAEPRELRRSAAPRGARRGLGAQGKGSERGPGQALSSSPPSPIHILGKARRRAPKSPDARLPTSLAGWAGRRRGAQTGFPRQAPSFPRPAPSEPARGGPRPAPRPPAPSGRAALQPRAAPRPWLWGGTATRSPAFVLARPLARSLARLATCAPGSGLRAPARRYNPRRRIVPSEEAARERPRASSAPGRHLVAAASPRSLPGLCEEEGYASAGAMALRPSLDHATS